MTTARAGKKIDLKPLVPAHAAELYAAIEASREPLRRRLRWVGGVRSKDDAAAFLRRAAEESARGVGRVFGIFEAKTGILAGVAALQGLIEVPGLAEFSGWVRADRQERGYFLEAGRLLAAHAFRKEGLHRLHARIDPANRSARRVLQKLGFRYEGSLRHAKRLNGRWVDQECWGLLEDEWKK